MVCFTQSLFRRGSQVVRPSSAKALCVGSIPTRASINLQFRLEFFWYLKTYAELFRMVLNNKVSKKIA